MILDAERFLQAEQPYWKELATCLDAFDREPNRHRTLPELERFHYLYQRSATCLARLTANSGDPEVRAHLESLVARAYCEVHQQRSRTGSFSFWSWLKTGFPRAFRRQIGAFGLSVAITVAGISFGWIALRVNPDSRSVLMPFQGLMESPHERVAREERIQGVANRDELAGKKTTFSAELMTHNIRVSVLTLAMGMTWGIGVITLLFYNGVSLGAVASDYIRDGQMQFLLGWLLPHGVIEIPAILIAGQAGFVLARALIGWGQKGARRKRLAAIRGDLSSLAGGMALMLVWAGLIEAFVSQYHRPVLPYGLKIAFGIAELILLAAWLSQAGREEHDARS